jgi:hypothetical protein
MVVTLSVNDVTSTSFFRRQQKADTSFAYYDADADAFGQR